MSAAEIPDPSILAYRPGRQVKKFTLRKMSFKTTTRKIKRYIVERNFYPQAHLNPRTAKRNRANIFLSWLINPDRVQRS